MEPRFLIIPSLVLSFCPAIAPAQWVQTIDSIAVYSFASTSSSTYAGIHEDVVRSAGFSVYASTTNGLSWENVGNCVGGPNVSGLVTSDGNTFAGTNGEWSWGICRSTDNGTGRAATWTDRQVLSLGVKEGRLFAGLCCGDVAVSPDNGTSWTPGHLGGTSATVFTLLSADGFTQSDRRHTETVRLRSIGNMNAQRFAHTSTLLPDGRVLIAGGQNSVALASAELFDPASNTFTATPTMSTARSSHTATLLPNGTVLIAGGYNGSYLATAEIYNPATGDFTPVSSMSVARSGHEAILLKNGKVLLAGGVGTGWTFLSSAEVYDPETSTFAPTGSMTTARESHTTTLLNNGKVLISGGHKDRRAAITIYASAELYDPSTGTFSPTGNMTLRRHKHDATLLPDGTVLIVGGADEQDRDGAYTSMEKYSPDTGKFTAVGNMSVRRYKHRGTTIVLPTSRVLIGGGATTAEIFDPSANATVKAAGSFGSDRLFSTATLLRDGRVLITGGYNQNMATSSGAWIVE